MHANVLSNQVFEGAPSVAGLGHKKAGLSEFEPILPQNKIIRSPGWFKNWKALRKTLLRF